MAEPVNTPMPPGTPISMTPRCTSPVLAFSSLSFTTKPIVLHLGDPVKYNPQLYTTFASQFTIIRPSTTDRQRLAFIHALRTHRYGNFSAIFRPFWSTGGEMGHWDEELVSLLPESCRVFASAGAGFDWADVEALGQRGVIYCNGGLAAAEAVADFAVSMIVGVFRGLPYCVSSATGGRERWEECHEHATGRSRNLRGMVLGVVGLGNIGQQVAKKMQSAFGMELLYFDVEKKSKEIEEELELSFVPSLKELVQGSDCVVLCVPSGAGKLINEESLAWFKQGARLVNVARGSLVDEDALADALEEGRLSAVALDVHANEPEVHPRLKALADTKALLTCHNAGGTVETHVGFEELAMKNIMAVLGGGEPITPVNLHYLKRDE